jgi:hypothetical protein
MNEIYNLAKIIMNRILIIFIAVILISTDKNEIDFNTYHQKFIEVEILIADENFKDAETELEALLLEYKPSFTKDYVIFAQLCLLNNNETKAIKWLKESMKYGAKIDCLKDIEFLNQNIDDVEWGNIEKEEKTLNEIYHSKINFSLGKRFNNDYQIEQDSKSKKDYKSVVYSNFSKIKTLSDKGKFPGEYLIGIDNADFAPKIYECDFSNSKVIVTLLHYDYPITELTEEKLVTAISKGQLHPREFASIFTFEKNKTSVLYGISYKTTIDLPDYNFMFPFEKRKDTIDKVNEDRRNFGICSVETDRGKKLIEEKYGVKLDFGYK